MEEATDHLLKVNVQVLMGKLDQLESPFSFLALICSAVEAKSTLEERHLITVTEITRASSIHVRESLFLATNWYLLNLT